MPKRYTVVSECRLVLSTYTDVHLVCTPGMYTCKAAFPPPIMYLSLNLVQIRILSVARDEISIQTDLSKNKTKTLIICGLIMEVSRVCFKRV